MGLETGSNIMSWAEYLTYLINEWLPVSKPNGKGRESRKSVSANVEDPVLDEPSSLDLLVPERRISEIDSI